VVVAADAASVRNPARRRLLWLLAVLAGIATFVGTRDGNAGDDVLARPVAHGQAVATQQSGPRLAAIGSARATQARGAQLAVSLARALDADAKPIDWPSPPEAARRSWEGAPAPSSAGVQAAGNPPPVPPELPFQWIGLWEQPSAGSGVSAPPVAIIAASRGTRLVRTGDVLEDDWKVDGISGDQIQLTYLPLQVRQTLAMNKK
jgi:hypothetical protein